MPQRRPQRLPHGWAAGKYPQQRLTDAWTLVLAGQFHDVGAGTATPRAYQFVQNDDVIALNQFADVLTTATRSIASGLNTDAPGVPIVLYNSLNIDRQDVVEARLPDSLNATNVQVYSPEGKPVPTQVEGGRLLFLARVPSVGFAVYSARNVAAPKPTSDLKVSKLELENARYRVRLNDAGDITSVFDKSLHRELLSAPIRLAISNDAPKQYPAWNMDFDQEQAAPRAYVSGPATIRVVEDGPVRVAVQVMRDTEGSHFVQTVSLSAGSAGNRVEFHDSIDWHTSSANLKAVFPLAAQNRMATYNWEVGTIQRPTAEPNQFEVASHYWIDLTDQSKAFGTTVLTDVKNGSDKPDAHTIRLTLLRTPGFPANITPQAAEHRDLQRPAQSGLGPPRNPVRSRRPLRRLASGQHRLAGLPAQHTADGVHHFAPSRRARAGRSRSSTQQPGRPYPRAKEGGVLRRHHPAYGRAPRSRPSACPRSVRRADRRPPKRRMARRKSKSAAPSQRRAQRLLHALPAAHVRPPSRRCAHTSGRRHFPACQFPLQPRCIQRQRHAVRTGASTRRAMLCRPRCFPPSFTSTAWTSTSAGGANHPDALIPAGQTISLPAGDYNRIYMLAASAERRSHGHLPRRAEPLPLSASKIGPASSASGTREFGSPSPTTRSTAKNRSQARALPERLGRLGQPRQLGSRKPRLTDILRPVILMITSASNPAISSATRWPGMYPTTTRPPDSTSLTPTAISSATK